MTQSQHIKHHSIKINHSDENATAFAGMTLAQRVASRAGLWSALEKQLPERNGYDWLTIIKSITAGLLTGARGTFSAEDLREDRALLTLLGLRNAPEEATVWRALEGLGEMQDSGLLPKIQRQWTRKILGKTSRNILLRHGFFPLFADGTLLEGSRKREATKFIKDKGEGVLWSTIFAGPLLADQRLAREGEGEETCVRDMLEGVARDLLDPLQFRSRALLLADSLHGDGPTLDEVERLRLRYAIGADKLSATAATLHGQPDWAWQDSGARPSRGWSRAGFCVCWLQCASWEKKRALIGRRWMREGEMIWNYSGVVTNLTEEDVADMTADGLSFAEAVSRLYDMKMGMETYYRDLLSDLGLHHPPCRELKRNAGFYAAASFAHTLGVAVDLLGAAIEDRGSNERQDGKRRKRPRSRRMRLWRLRRRFFALPGRVASRGRELTITLLGLGEKLRQEFDRMFLAICRC